MASNNAQALLQAMLQNSPRMSAATPEQVAYGRTHNLAPNDGTYWTPAQERQAHAMQRQNNPVDFFTNPIARWLGLKQIAQQGAASFDPRSRAGLLNLASMFAGGPKGDATPQMEALGMHGQFAPYDSVVYKTGSPLDRGVAHEGPTRATGGTEGAGIRGLVRRAEGKSPFNRPDPIKAAAARRAVAEKEAAQAFQRQQMLRALAARKRLDEHLNSAPMHGLAEHPAAEHDYFTSHEFDKHVNDSADFGSMHDARQNLLHVLMQRRYQAGSMHHHN